MQTHRCAISGMVHLHLSGRNPYSNDERKYSFYYRKVGSRASFAMAQYSSSKVHQRPALCMSPLCFSQCHFVLKAGSSTITTWLPGLQAFTPSFSWRDRETGKGRVFLFHQKTSLGLLLPWCPKKEIELLCLAWQVNPTSGAGCEAILFTACSCSSEERHNEFRGGSMSYTYIYLRNYLDSLFL